jgi:hypothetical protein
MRRTNFRNRPPRHEIIALFFVLCLSRVRSNSAAVGTRLNRGKHRFPKYKSHRCNTITGTIANAYLNRSATASGSQMCVGIVQNRVDVRATPPCDAAQEKLPSGFLIFSVTALEYSLCDTQSAVNSPVRYPVMFRINVIFKELSHQSRARTHLLRNNTSCCLCSSARNHPTN